MNRQEQHEATHACGVMVAGLGETYEEALNSALATCYDAGEAYRESLWRLREPEGALRQGEFFFVLSYGPHAAANCEHGRTVDPSWPLQYDLGLDSPGCGSTEYCDAGSYTYTLRTDRFSGTHTADVCLSVQKSGHVAFVWRGNVHRHQFTGRPRYFAAGGVEHPQHGRLDLPPHSIYGGWSGRWYEVIPNRAHGPFPERDATGSLSLGRTRTCAATTRCAQTAVPGKYGQM